MLAAKKEKNLSAKVKNNKHVSNEVFIHLSIGLLLFFAGSFDLVQARVRSQSKSRRHSHVVKKHHPTQEEELAAKEAAAREAAEARLIEGKNVILARAYKLYDSGTSESMQGNYKYAILQLKLADELLSEHGQTNSSLFMVTLTALASAAQSAKEYSLARASYERILSARPKIHRFCWPPPKWKLHKVISLWHKIM